MKLHRLSAALLLLGLFSVGIAQQSTPAGASPSSEQSTGIGAAPASQQSGTTPSATVQPPPQQSNPAANEPSDKNAPEISSQESVASFKVKVNLVEVRVVVRDASGHVIGNLKQDDFQLFDNGKPQVISRFSVEQAGTARPATPVHQEVSPALAETKSTDAAVPALPRRYIAYLFDDVHLEAGDLAQARNAAQANLQGLESTDRAAILSTSGQTRSEFTADRATLQEALNTLRPRPVSRTLTTECPAVSYYLADQIQNKHDPVALSVVSQDALDCGAASDQLSAGRIAQSAALQELEVGGHETQVVLASLKDAIRKIAGMPGQRSIVLVSPGFLNPDQLQEQTAILDIALHSSVVINALDARGLFTSPFLDASRSRPSSGKTAAQMDQYASQEALANDDVMADLAYTTGGIFVRNTNDLRGGLQRLAGAPETSYLLAFSPQNLKLDGSFHKLKVQLTRQNANIQARKGYFAPKQGADAAEQTRQEIADIVFSQEERSDIPVQVHTQFFKASDEDAKLSVLIRVDMRRLHFRKIEGRNHDDVTVVSAIFDRNGNFVVGNQKLLKMRLKDDTLAAKLGSGLLLRTSFDVKPGSYLVRLVVRDEEGQVAAQNSAVQIP
jgi:VWFA-related protein